MDESGAIDPFPTPHWFSLAEPASSGGTSVGIPGIEHVLPAIFAIIFVLWAVYSLVAAYHWFRYGHRSFVAIPILIAHVVVSGFLMVLTTTGLH